MGQNTHFSQPASTHARPSLTTSKSHTGRPGKILAAVMVWSAAEIIEPPPSRAPGAWDQSLAITESPLSRSMSSPELSTGIGFGHPLPKSPLIYSETISTPATRPLTMISKPSPPGSPRSTETVWSAFCVNGAPSPEAPREAVRPSPKLRSMSESFLSMTTMVSSGLQHSASIGAARAAKSRPVLSVAEVPRTAVRSGASGAAAIAPATIPGAR